MWRLAEPAEQASSAARLDGMINVTLGTQSADGAYRFQLVCGQAQQFMDGMFNDALIQIYENYRQDPRIVTAVRKNADFQWTQWRPEAGALQYVSGECPGTGSVNDLWPTLNQLSINTFAWTYAQGGGTVYRDRADQLFAGAVNRSTLTNPKEFNQQYTTSYRYLWYRSR
jgi:hypothetical protein